jgi:hypothetical protein
MILPAHGFFTYLGHYLLARLIYDHVPWGLILVICVAGLLLLRRRRRR